MVVIAAEWVADFVMVVEGEEEDSSEAEEEACFMEEEIYGVIHIQHIARTITATGEAGDGLEEESVMAPGAVGQDHSIDSDSMDGAVGRSQAMERRRLCKREFWFP